MAFKKHYFSKSAIYGQKSRDFRKCQFGYFSAWKFIKMNFGEFWCPQMWLIWPQVCELDCGFVVHVAKFVHIFSQFSQSMACVSQSCLNNWSKVVFNERVDPGVSFTFLKSSFTEHHNIYHNFNILFVLRYTSFALTELVY